MSIQEKLHKFLFPSFDKKIKTLKEEREGFKNDFRGYLNRNPSDKELEVLYNDNKHLFEQFIIKDMTGDIPQSVLEPVLKVFNEQGEDIERWVLWQSYQMRQRVMQAPANPLKIQFYDGVLFFLKQFQVLANQGRTKKTLTSETQQSGGNVEPSYIHTAMTGVEEFIEGFKPKEEPENTEE